MKSKTFVLVVFLCALGWQIFHTAEVVGRMDSAESIWSNYAFAVAVQFTALLMTVHSDGAIGYLRGFAFIEFAINMAYYQPWLASTGIEVWALSILLSFIIAFTIFCYSKILTS
ncbi:MAG: hypothetical protein AAFY91_10565 [Bacteroidota bacterium]